MDLKLDKVYYGWWIVGACFFLMLLLSGFSVLSFTAFFEPIVEEFKWTYAQISLASSLRGVGVGLLAPLLGFLVDRWGPRRLALAGVAFLGVGFIILSRTTSLAMFYSAFAIIAVGASGLSPTVTMTPVANWFKKKVGIASGIVATGFATGSLVILLVVRLIDAFSWQVTILILGVTIWIIGFPLSLLLRQNPEKYGYVVDGTPDAGEVHSDSVSSMKREQADLKLREVLKSRVFWHIGIALACQFLVISAITVHVMPYLTTVGFSRSTSSLVATAAPLISIAGRLGSGWFIDRFNTIKVAVFFIFMVFMGVIILSFVSDARQWLIILFIIFYGIGWGGNATMRTALIRENFGIGKFGTIFGLLMGMSAIGGIVGPFVAGWTYDMFLNYRVAWIIFAFIVFIALTIIATIPREVFYTQSTSKDK